MDLGAKEQSPGHILFSYAIFSRSKLIEQGDPNAKIINWPFEERPEIWRHNKCLSQKEKRKVDKLPRFDDRRHIPKMKIFELTQRNLEFGRLSYIVKFYVRSRVALVCHEFGINRLKSKKYMMGAKKLIDLF